MRKEDRSLDETVVSPSNMGRVAPSAIVRREDHDIRDCIWFLAVGKGLLCPRLLSEGKIIPRWNDISDCNRFGPCSWRGQGKDCCASRPQWLMSLIKTSTAREVTLSPVLI